MHEGDIAGGEVLGTDDDAQRHAAQLPVRVLLAGAHPVAPVDAQPNRRRAFALEARAASSTTAAPASSLLRVIGTTTTWIGATFGGMIRPMSSPWAMITRADGPRRQPPRGLKRMLELRCRGRCT